MSFRDPRALKVYAVNYEMAKKGIDPAILRALSISDASSAKLSTHGGSGFASTFRIDKSDTSIFVKTGSTSSASTMFEGEHASLNAIHSAVPTLAPKAFAWGALESENGYFLATEFLDMSGRGAKGGGMSLAEKLAKLHTASVPESVEGKGFGFEVPTCCGETVQDNSWKSSWAEFFAENRLRLIITKAEQNGQRDKALKKLVDEICDKVVPRLLGDGHLGGTDGISPRLVHGDLWSGNKGKATFLGRRDDENGVENVVFDPSCCYGHFEFDHGIMNMFGGFGSDFWNTYWQLCPKTKPVDEYDDRVKLYEAYHHLNHYAMFGGGYKSGAINLLQPLLKKYS